MRSAARSALRTQSADCGHSDRGCRPVPVVRLTPTGQSMGCKRTLNAHVKSVGRAKAAVGLTWACFRLEVFDGVDRLRQSALQRWAMDTTRGPHGCSQAGQSRAWRYWLDRRCGVSRRRRLGSNAEPVHSYDFSCTRLAPAFRPRFGRFRKPARACSRPRLRKGRKPRRRSIPRRRRSG